MNSGDSSRVYWKVFWKVLLIATVNILGFDLKIEGTDFFSNRKIKDQLSFFPESPNEEKVENWKREALSHLEDLYRKNGFFDVSITINLTKERPSPKTKQKGKVPEYIADIVIKEGKRYIFGEILFQFPDSALKESQNRVQKEELDARQGNLYKKLEVAKSSQIISKMYGNLGFVRVKVEAEEIINAHTSAVQIIFYINPGLPVVFDTLRINNKRPAPMDNVPAITADNILRDLVPYQWGDTVTVRQNDNIIEKLQSTGLYNYVRLEDSLLQNGRSRLVLSMQEKVPGHLRTSIYYETTDGPGVTFDFSFSNVLGTMNEVRAGTDFALNKQEFKLGFGSPLPFGFRLRFDNDVEVEWNQSSRAYEEYGLNPGLFEGDFLARNSSRLSRTFFYWLRGVTEVEIDRSIRLINPDTSQTSQDLTKEVGSNLNFISTGFVTFLNNIINPTRGSRYSLTWGNGGDFWVDEQINYTRHNWLELRSSYYYPLFSQLVGAVRADAGRFFKEGETNSQRFFLGGPRSVRSYAYHEICPTQTCEGVGVEPAYFLVSVEARTALFDFSIFPSPLRLLELVPFVDFGFVRDLTTSSSNEGRALGFGFRYPLFQIFNLRLDWAWGHPEGGRLLFTNRYAYLPDSWVIDLAQAF